LRPRVLVLARNYPNDALPRLGLWTQRLVQCSASSAEVKVVAPVPYLPPLPRIGPLVDFARYARVRRRRLDGDVEVLHPALLTGPGYTLHNIESVTYALAALPTVHRLRRRFAFDLIHAHFGYPDGVVACALGRKYRVPVVMTEHAPWLPWMQRYPLVRHQAVWAAKSCAAHIAVSRSLRETIVQVSGDSTKVHVIPNVVDGTIFRPPQKRHRVPGQILFVGVVRHVKGVDILLEALGELRQRHPAARLLLAGQPFYRSYQQAETRLQRRTRELGLDNYVEWIGDRTPAQVARLMSESQVVVLPSRSETFGSVLIEALACGTPVVATRCGGPEEIVTAETGRLVPREDPSALAGALADVLEQAERYDPAVLRGYALGRYGVPVVAQQLATLYDDILGRPWPRSHDSLPGHGDVAVGFVGAKVTPM
jgi:teichuronic acid biosynthesis glycosyltransferase TuaC